MAADFLVVAMSWLVMGALLAWYQGVSLRTDGLELGEWTAVRLVGLAVLHGALITLLAYTEGLQLEGMSLAEQTEVLSKSVLWATAVLCFAYGLQGASLQTCELFGGAAALGFGGLWSLRWWGFERDRRLHKNSGTRHVLIVGSVDVGRRIASHFKEHAAERAVVGFLDDDRPSGSGVVGRVRDLARVTRERFVDEVILAAPHDSDLTRWTLEECRRLRLDVEIVPDLFGCKAVEHEMERVGGLPAICVHAEPLPAAALTLKRVVDVVGSAAALTVLSPLLAALATLIKIDSKGTVLYSAERVGRKGRLFRCYKFRTMVSNADELKGNLRLQNERKGPIFKITADPRITRVGKYLRRYSLDELPQLWNVLVGEMSLVGPRPHPLDDFAEYELEHLARLDVTPGITGLWQVTARRDPSFHRGMELDREYIRSWSLRLDAQILFKTFRAVLCGSGD